MYITFSYPFIHQQTVRLFPYLGYCELTLVLAMILWIRHRNHRQKKRKPCTIYSSCLFRLLRDHDNFCLPLSSVTLAVGEVLVLDFVECPSLNLSLMFFSWLDWHCGFRERILPGWRALLLMMHLLKFLLIYRFPFQPFLYITIALWKDPGHLACSYPVWILLTAHS